MIQSTPPCLGYTGSELRLVQKMYQDWMDRLRMPNVFFSLEPLLKILSTEGGQEIGLLNAKTISLLFGDDSIAIATEGELVKMSVSSFRTTLQDRPENRLLATIRKGCWTVNSGTTPLTFS